MLPSKVTIAGIEYSVNEEELVIMNESTAFAGAHSLAKCEIEIWKAGSLQYKQLTLSHEVFHAMLAAVKYDMTDKEEQFVLSMERVFYQFLKENTDFFQTKVTEPCSNPST